jgi:2-succinyl-6-hydroxy-2,4-cyclohexadiene-1-carboxylate synthase
MRPVTTSGGPVGGNFAMTVVGSGAQRVVMLHGFAHTARSWHPIAVDLVRSHPDVSCLLPDLPGHGATDVRPSFDELTEHLVDLAHDAVIVGYSMGARFALAAACHPNATVRGLVIVGGTAGIRDADERERRRADDERLATRVETIGTDAFLDEWLARPLFAGYVPDAESMLDRRRNAAGGLSYALRELGPGSQRSYWEFLANLRVPTLAVAGARDTKFAALATEICALVPGCQRRLVADAGHVAHLEQPATFVRLLSEFLSRSDVRRRTG